MRRNLDCQSKDALGRPELSASPRRNDRYLRIPADDRRPSPAVVPLRAWTDRDRVNARSTLAPGDPDFDGGPTRFNLRRFLRRSDWLFIRKEALVSSCGAEQRRA
jgi:hypothetical protein